MWYTSAYNKISGMGGGILPPLPPTNNKIATPPEVEQLKLEADNQMPPPAEELTTQQKLESLHTNGRFSLPPYIFQGINPPAAIEDQYKTTGTAGQGYDQPQRM